LKTVNKINKPLANLTKMRGEKTQISKIRNEKGEITINTMEIQGTNRDYSENLYFPISWKILKKWIDFQILMTIQN
jgi:hypothetical protein